MMRKKKRKEGNYKQCWEYLKESRNYLLFIILAFIAAILTGLFFPVFLNEFIEKFIKELLEKTEGMNFFQLFIFIFKNNLVTSFMGLIFGLFFGVFPLILCLFNGYVLGFIAGRVAGASGMISLWRILPHGVFELPALIISLGLGLKLGMFILAKEGKRKKQFFYDLENCLRVFIFIILPLLLIAGLVETALIFLTG